MMTLRLDQLVYTSFQNSGLQLLASTHVTSEVQGIFMSQIVDQYWDPCNPYESEYQAAYIHQAAANHTFFGWIYHEEYEGTDRGYVPLFLCYHVEGHLNADLLESIFACLQRGPTQLVDPQAEPPHLTELEFQALEDCHPVRAGVTVPQDIRVESFAALEQDEVLSLFVPSLGTNSTNNMVPLAQAKATPDIPYRDKSLKSRWVKLGAVGIGLVAALCSLSLYRLLRSSVPAVTTVPAEENMSPEVPATGTIASVGQPGTRLPKLQRVQPQGQQKTTARASVPSSTQRRQQPGASSKARARTPRQPKGQATTSQVARLDTSQTNRTGTLKLDALLPPSSNVRFTTGSVNWKGLELATQQNAAGASSPNSARPLVSVRPQVQPQRPESKVTENKAAVMRPPVPDPIAASPQATPVQPVPAAKTAPPTTTTPPDIAGQQANSSQDAAEDANRLAEIATQQELANVLARGLVVANRAGQVPYRSSRYLRVQNVIRRLRTGENWTTAAQQSGISEGLISNLAQLAYDADLDAASVKITKGVTTHDIANAIARGLVIANREGEIRYRSHTYLKVQDVIHRLRLGQNRHYAAQSSGVQQALIEKLLVLGGLPPASSRTVS